MEVGETVLYLTKIRCQSCGALHRYGRQGPPTPMDQDVPWPSGLEYCPSCASEYPDDLAVVIEEVRMEEVRSVGRSLLADDDQ